ncbi:MAG: DUF445 family protein [Firmicutes bacterium]|nr:DUF445 family protein [Bacillota bacterium]
MFIKFIAAPVLGGIIGYITNDIAIRMLFRPRNAVYIGGRRLPFTPGLIPRQKDRIAVSLGRIVSTQLMNRETIEATIRSPESVASVHAMFEKLMEKWKNDERTVRERLNTLFDDEEIDGYALSLQESLTDSIVKKALEADIGETLLRREKTVILHGILRDAAINFVNKLIEEKLPQIVFEQIGIAEKDLLKTRLCDIYAGYEDKIPQLINKLVDIYETLAVKNIDKVLEIVDIEHMVEEKVKAFDAEELETLIFGLMRRELRAIVYIGAMLGFLMGFINLLFFI